MTPQQRAARERYVAERNAKIAANREKRQQNRQLQIERGLRPLDLPEGKHPVFDHPDWEMSQMVDTDPEDRESDD